MTREEFRQLLGRWCGEEGDEASKFARIRSRVDFLEKVLFEKYAPVQVGIHGKFGLRLAQWVGGTDDEDYQKALYLLLGHLTFFGQEQMKAGHSTAFSRNVLSWLADVEQVDFFDPSAEHKIRQAVNETAFTEITDSFRLNDFLRENNLAGHSTRYTWEQDLDRWNAEEFESHVMGYDRDTGSAEKKHLVLFEDFVGTGTQMATAVNYACSLTRRYNLLLCPIVICPKGAELARDLANRHENLVFEPVLELPESAFITRHPRDGEPDDYRLIRPALEALHPKVCGTPNSWAQKTPPYGYKDTGAIFCKYDNCPDNTVPVVHHKSDRGWEPLFFRTSRV